MPYAKSRVWRMGSAVTFQPGTMAVGENDTPSTSEKKFVGFLFRVILPKGMRGKSFWEMVLVGSKMLVL